MKEVLVYNNLIYYSIAIFLNQFPDIYRLARKRSKTKRGEKALLRHFSIHLIREQIHRNGMSDILNPHWIRTCGINESVIKHLLQLGNQSVVAIGLFSHSLYAKTDDGKRCCPWPGGKRCCPWPSQQRPMP
jgi:hypothetical protein